MSNGRQNSLNPARERREARSMNRLLLLPLAMAAVATIATALPLAGDEAPCCATTSSVARAEPTAAAHALEHFKALAGRWHGTNARGESVTASYEVVADGATVLERFECSPEGEPVTMLTVYHLDGSDLVLTHYCMAGNQPRMRATSFDESGVTFGFVGGTNMASADAGHMHRARFTFEDSDRFTTSWTWHEDGEDRFVETCTLERVTTG